MYQLYQGFNKLTRRGFLSSANEIEIQRRTEGLSEREKTGGEHFSRAGHFREKQPSREGFPVSVTSTPHGCGIQISSLLAICGVGFHLYHSSGQGKITPTLFQFVKICQSICSRVVSTSCENASAGLCSFPCFHLFGGEQGCSSWGQRSWVSTDD